MVTLTNSDFIRVCTVLLRLKQSSGTDILHYLEKNLPVTPYSTQWAAPYLLYQYVWENPSEYKGLIQLT